MSEKPILFSAPMVRAILAGHKTQTRRVLKPQPGVGQSAHLCSTAGIDWQIRGGLGQVLSSEMLPYAFGHTLWVREAWRAHAEHDANSPLDIPPGSPVQYLADDPLSPWLSKTRASIHMPRWASRIDLRVTGVRIKRLQDTSEDDAMAEGIVSWHDDGRRPHEHISAVGCQGTQRDLIASYWGSASQAFRVLWESINGSGAWDQNPWVAAITFERVKP